MSLRSLLEIVVHLESFRNVDLFYQGLYYLKVNVYYKKGEEVIKSIINMYKQIAYRK
jgi:hypothetical protein